METEWTSLDTATAFVIVLLVGCVVLFWWWWSDTKYYSDLANEYRSLWCDVEVRYGFESTKAASLESENETLAERVTALVGRCRELHDANGHASNLIRQLVHERDAAKRAGVALRIRLENIRDTATVDAF